jgi:hypothetical protein
MPKYILDIDAWANIEADNDEHAMSVGQTIINICDEALANEGYQVSMVVRDGGIQYLEEEN